VRKRGIVPLTLEKLLAKRAAYKRLMKGAKDEESRRLYDERQTSLKWILVCSFGFMGYRNSKFGRIDAHIAVCAFARKILLDAMRIAEREGFRVIHGIVDSLWLKREGASEEDYVHLCSEIERETGFRISFEGIYRWIAFLPSKTDGSTPVLNRYFGVFTNGKVKFRGIEARRRDTPKVIPLSQISALNILAHGESIDGARRLVPAAINNLIEYAGAIKCGFVPLSDLLVERQISKRPSNYLQRTPQTQASRLLDEKGVALQPGNVVRFLITNSRLKEGVPEELLSEDQAYDRRKYLDLLASASATILIPFGFDKDRLRTILSNPTRQRIAQVNKEVVDRGAGLRLGAD
jgi:DNA polymerase-2